MDVGSAALRRAVGLLVCLLGAAVLPTAIGPMVLGQVVVKAKPGADELREVDVFPRPERALVRQLTSAKELIAQRRWGEAVRCLDVVLRSPEDYLYQPDEKVPLHRSLQSEANRVLGRMPREGRELYELQYGSPARRLLEKAVAARDRDLLDEVSRRFFHTVAGQEATFLLGLYDFDHGEPLAAALTFEQLRDEASRVDRFEPVLSLSLATCWHQAGFVEKAEAVLRRLRDRRAEWPLSVAGREQTFWPADGERLMALAAEADSAPVAVDWRGTQWTQPRADAARTASARASRPLLEPVWRIPTSDHPTALSFLAAQSGYSAERSAPLVPTLQPLATDGVVLMRSLRTLLAVDGQTGKRLWEVPVDDVLDESPDAYRALFKQPGELTGLVCQRAWRDGVYGTLSSDGHRVFAVEDLGLNLGNRSRRATVQGGRQVAESIWPKSYNRLAAYDIATGKLVWHLGGSGEDFGLNLSGTFFLGSPLVMSDRLYQLAEAGGEIRLLAMEAASGEVLWSQRIALVEQNVLANPARRSTALSPSYQDGVLVCPTGVGAIVGVKLARRSLLWGYRYASSSTPRSRRSSAAVRYANGANLASQWIDANLVLSDGRVLATPPDSNEIHCLDLLDGKLVWKKPRGDGLYLAAVADKAAVLVGADRLRALSLADGTPAWEGRTIKLPEGSVASGQGFRSGKLYYLPLCSAEMLVVDLVAGKIRRKLASASGVVPGNLVCCGERIISQGIDGVAAFEQLEPLRNRIAKALAENPDDAEALRQQGQVFLAAGRRSEAVECLRRSYHVAPSPKCRQQLRDALFDGLRDEFADYESSLGEIEKLLDTRAQGVEYLRLLAEGFQSRSAWKATLECYLRLADSRDEYYDRIKIDRFYAVREDRWLSARLLEFRELAPAEVVAELDRRVRERLDTILEDDDVNPLARFVACFDGQPEVGEAKRELANRYLGSGQLLKAETLLRRRTRSSDPAEAAATMLDLASVFEKAGRPGDAAACYRELAERWGDVACRDGKTGRQWAAAVPSDSPIAARMYPERRWPVGEVHVGTTERSQSEQRAQATVALPFYGQSRPFFTSCAGAMDQGRQTLVLLDGFGREQWRLGIANINQYYMRSPHYRNRLSARGHLMLLSLGSRCVAMDTLAGEQPRVLWSKNMMGGAEDAGESFDVARLAAQWGPRIVITNVPGQGRQADPIAPNAFTDEYVCYQRYRRCAAVDPLSGKLLWSRRDLPPQCTVFGDADRVFLVPPGSGEAIVLAARDGRRLAEAKAVPPRQEWIATPGGNILRWYSQGGKLRLELFDPWDQKILWGPHSFSPQAKRCLLDEQALGVMEPGGRFVLFTLPDGKKQIDTQLEPERALDDVVLFDSGSGYLLVTSSRGPAGTQNQRRLRRLYGTTSKMIQRGRVYAFDRSGRRLWPERPKGIEIENQQLLLHQPEALPVLTFAAQTYSSGVRGIQWVVSVLMIDKRTGREVVDEDYQDRVTGVMLAGDPERRTVSFAMREKDLKLTFTDKPLAPRSQPGQTPGTSAKRSKTLDTMLKALKKAAGG